MILDFRLLLFIAPAILLSLFAQYWVSSSFKAMSRVAARTTGFDAARRILDAAGLSHVAIEPVSGRLSDHYDSRAKVLRLSQEVYHGRSMAAVGVAAHEAGHALQDAKGYAPLVLRNMAVPAASFGSGTGMLMATVGVWLHFGPLLLLGIIVFSGVVIFQIVNLPVEFNASSRAKRELVNTGVIDPAEVPYVSRVLNAAALTYVAGTLQAVLTLVYFIWRFMGRQR